MITILDICDSYGVLNTIFLIKFVIKTISILVPIVLLVSLILTLTGSIISEDSNKMSKIISTIPSKIIAATIIFLVPTAVNLILNTTGTHNTKLSCYRSATYEIVQTLKSAEEARKNSDLAAAKAEVEEAKRKVEEIRRQQEEALKESLDNIENNDNVGNTDTSNQSDSDITSSSISSVDVTDLSCAVYYSDHTTIFSKIRVNSQITSQIHGILGNVCNYVNSNPNITRLETAGAYVEKAGYHGMGLAIDLFNLWSIEYNGKTYTPYSQYGYGEWNNYNNFICEVCNGKENCQYNINYIIYERYFKGNGWCWGGNWGKSYFDPMHFELTKGGCSTSNKSEFSC